MRNRFVLPFAPLALCLAFAAPLAAGAGPVSRFDAAKAKPAEVAVAARASAPGALFRIQGLRGAEGESLTLDLETAPLFTADFHLYIDGRDHGKEPVARLTFLRGTVEEWPRSSVALTVDSETGAWNGFLAADDRFYEVHAPAGAERDSIAQSVAIVKSTVEPAARNGVLSDVFEAPPRALQKAIQSKTVAAPGTEYQATLAIESDYEMTHLLFFGDTGAATEYLTGIIGGVSELYLRQVGVSLVISSLSLYTTPDDPWNAPNPNTGAGEVLCEFSSYWQSFRPVKDYPRHAAMFFTGKRNNDNGGQAFLSSLCSFNAKPSSCPTGGYGMVVATKSSFDYFITSHELGHVFGSSHTHCYKPPIDECLSGESGCYSGPVSVPPDGGSVMSYCFPNNLSLGEPGKYGHDSQRVVQVIQGFVDTVGAGCLPRTNDPFALAAAPGSGKATLSWIDPFPKESNWLVEQLQANGKFKQVKSLPANAKSVTITGLKHHVTYSFRVRAKIKKDFSVYSNVVPVAVP